MEETQPPMPNGKLWQFERHFSFWGLCALGMHDTWTHLTSPPLGKGHSPVFLFFLSSFLQIVFYYN